LAKISRGNYLGKVLAVLNKLKSVEAENNSSQKPHGGRIQQLLTEQGLMEVELKLPGFGDGDFGACTTRIAANLLDGLHDFHTGSNPSENDVLAVQPRSLGSAEEELASVGVGAGVGHGQNSRPGVLLDEVFIGELVAVNGLAAGAVASGEVSALAHEPGDDAVESRSLITEPFLAGAKSAEVFASFGTNV